MTIYCTYLTVYTGNKLPPFYIGSTIVDKISSGYHGSVKSKKYKTIWSRELKVNPSAFKTKIISTHSTRKDALEKELMLQRALNVVKCDMYINMSYAAPDGFFGMSTKGIAKPQSMKDKMRGNKNASFNKGKAKSEKHRSNIAKSLKGRIVTAEAAAKHSLSMRGRKWWHNDNGDTRLSELCPGTDWHLGRC